MAADHLLALLFVVASVTLLLLCIGIHNAWDSVVHLTLLAMRGAPGHRGGRREPEREPGMETAPDAD